MYTLKCMKRYDLAGRMEGYIALLSVILFLGQGILTTRADCLDCYQCSDVIDITECHSFTICSEDEYCSTDASRSNNQTRYTFGCRTKQRCTEVTASHPAIAIVGRQVPSNVVCSQCCTWDACNKHLCSNAHEYPVGLNDGLYVRLVGDVDYSGRLEVSLNGSAWGTVCSDRFSDDDAKVVCKMLGYPIHNAFSSLSERSGSGPIVLDDVICLGTESSLLQCQHSLWGTHNCNHGKDIAVTCPYLALRVRLVGDNDYSGLVEISIDGFSWGTVCRDRFNDNAAKVVCRMLGLPTKAAFYTVSSVSGTGSILLDDLDCTGTEKSLLDCRHTQWGTSNCYHRQDVAVFCPDHDLYIRLVGNTNNSGRVEVSIDNTTWGTVCGDGYLDNAAKVVCRMLGFPTLAAFYTISSASGTGCVLLEDLICTGTENSLLDCRHLEWGNTNCNHNRDLAVTCPYRGLDIRLVGNTNNSGRVEVSVDYSTWGTVCNNDFGDGAAKVVCRMLGFPTSYAFYTQSTVSGTGPILLDDVICLGTEATLLDCRHSWIGTHNCDHRDDIDVSCPYNGLSIRLVDGDEHSGRVEVSVDYAVWGTVCSDNFNNNSAKVVCRMLDFPTTAPSFSVSPISGTGPIYLDDVSCTGTEATLLDCRHDRWGTTNCRHTQDIAVTCR